MSTRNHPPFDNERYVQSQIAAFDRRFHDQQFSEKVVEFGGKPFGDHHAERVLPGYDRDAKAQILRGLVINNNAKIVMVVNAGDVVPAPDGRANNGRIRGDTQLRYDAETIRMINEASETHQLGIEGVVLAATPYQPSAYASDTIAAFDDGLYRGTGLSLDYHFEIENYPDPSVVSDPVVFHANSRLHEQGRPTVLISPGGGSGKFGVALSEFNNNLEIGLSTDFVKFETFPVFGLPPDHPVNLAFEAATADLGNTVMYGRDGATTYDKDIENFQLLKTVAKMYGEIALKFVDIESPMAFGVNVIERGIIDEAAINQAAEDEIRRRLARYQHEYRIGDGQLSTIQACAGALGKLAARKHIEAQR